MRKPFGTLARVAVIAALMAGPVLAQGGRAIQERILGQRIVVPPISERITVSPIAEGTGAFSAVPASSRSRIMGVVINELGIIVPSAGFVIVRSLQYGRVIGQTQVDNLGQFSMPGVDPGVYAADLVDGTGSVITSSPSFTVGIGQIVQITPVVSQSSLGGLASLIGSTTAGTVNSAVQAGVLAIETLAPISP